MVGELVSDGRSSQSSRTKRPTGGPLQGHGKGQTSDKFPLNFPTLDLGHTLVQSMQIDTRVRRIFPFWVSSLANSGAPAWW